MIVWQRKKELTVEEKLAQEKQNGLNNIERELAYINDPSYHFEIGDKVRYGNLKESIINEILYDGKVYGLKCVATNENYGNPYDYETYRVVARKIYGKTCVSEESAERYSFLSD